MLAQQLLVTAGEGPGKGVAPVRAIAILQRLRPLVPRDDRRIAETLDSASTVDIDYSFSRADLKPFVAALREALDEATARLDTPASLGGALEQVIHDAGG